MRHFEFLRDPDAEALFAVPPKAFSGTSEREVIADALGATLYSPANRPALAADLARARSRGLISSVVCLEDSIPDGDVDAACKHMISELATFKGDADRAPLTFVRVRTADQITRIVSELGDAADALVGFVLPKFSTSNATEYLEATAAASEQLSRRLWTMPVIETPEVIHLETRRNTLAGIAGVLREHRDQVLALRTGGTDLASVFGLRRPKELTVYDVRVVADVIADVVNVLGRPGPDGFVVTGPVWEYYSDSERIFKPQLRETPFRVHEEGEMRSMLLSAELDGLIREVVLDRANGLFGKTVIHPTHIPVVHALSVVSNEDHTDATAILDTGLGEGGAFGSEYGNKMNEANPHRAWAERTMRRAGAFGVARDGVSFVDLLAAVVRA